MEELTRLTCLRLQLLQREVYERQATEPSVEVANFAANTFRPLHVQLAEGRYTRCSHEAHQSQIKG